MSLLKSVFSVSAANIVTLFLNFFYIPIMINFLGYKMSIFGEAQIVESIISIIQSYFLLSLDKIYITSNKKENHLEYIVSTYIISSLIYFVSLIGFFIFYDLKIKFFIYLIIHGMVLSIYLIVNSYYRKIKRFNILSKARIFQILFKVIFGLSLGSIFVDPLVILCANLFGMIIFIIYLILKIEKKDIFKKINFKGVILYIKFNFKNRKNVIIFDTLNSLFENLAENIPIFLIKIFFGNELLGLYSVVKKIFQVTVRLISGTLYEIFLSYFNDTEKMIINSYKYISLISLGVFSLISIFSYPISSLLYSKEILYNSSILIKNLSPLFFGLASNFPYFGYFIAKNKVHILFVNNILLFLVRIFLIYFGSKFIDFFLVMLIYSIISMIIYQITFTFILKNDNNYKKILFVIIKYDIIIISMIYINKNLLLLLLLTLLIKDIKELYILIINKYNKMKGIEK